MKRLKKFNENAITNSSTADELFDNIIYPYENLTFIAAKYLRSIDPITYKYAMCSTITGLGYDEGEGEDEDDFEFIINYFDINNHNVRGEYKSDDSEGFMDFYNKHKR